MKAGALATILPETTLKTPVYITIFSGTPKWKSKYLVSRNSNRNRTEKLDSVRSVSVGFLSFSNFRTPLGEVGGAPLAERSGLLKLLLVF